MIEVRLMLEMIAQSAEDAIAIEAGGGGRIELVSHLDVGGLTPSFTCIEDVLKRVKIPVNIMVRPSDASFVLSDKQFEEICEQIKMIKSLGANGIVIGPLTSDGFINRTQLNKMAELALGMEITFHRAFEDIKKPMEALDMLKRMGFISSILTNGGGKDPFEKAEFLSEIADCIQPMRLLIGGGISIDSFECLIRKFPNCDYHIGTAVRRNKSPFETVEEPLVKKFVEIQNKFKPQPK